jgi:DNA gyrase subunit B
LSYLNKGIRITLVDEREQMEGEVATPQTEEFYSEGGIVEFVQMLDRNGKRDPLLGSPIYVEAHDKESNVAVDVAFRTILRTTSTFSLT